MGVFRPVVAAPAGDMFVLHAEIGQGRSIGRQLVCYDGIRRETLFLEQLAHQLERCFLIAAGLDQNIQHNSFGIDRSPQVHPSAVDRDEDLIQMPTRIGLGSLLPEACGIGLPELQAPAPDGLVAHVDAAFSEQILDIREAQGKAKEQSDGVADDLWRKAVTVIADLVHARTLPHRSAPRSRLM